MEDVHAEDIIKHINLKSFPIFEFFFFEDDPGRCENPMTVSCIYIPLEWMSPVLAFTVMGFKHDSITQNLGWSDVILGAPSSPDAVNWRSVILDRIWK